MSYGLYAAIANKVLQPNGSVTTFEGTEILPANAERAEEYSRRLPLVNKVLQPDGTVTATLGVASNGADVDVAEIKEKVDHIVEEILTIKRI